MKIPYIKQNDLKDCGVSCLMSIIKYYKGYAQREYLREITNTTENGVSVYSLVKSAKKLGFEAKAVKGNIQNIKNKTPFIAHILINNKIGHFVVVYNISDNYIYVMDPAKGYVKYSLNNWISISTNIYILYIPINEIIKQKKENNFKKIITPALIKQKKIIILIVLFSIIYTFSSIILSYNFKLFLENKTNFKQILLILILIIIIKELSNLIRNNLTNKINHNLDKSLVLDIYNHLIKLPYLYFKSRNTGDILTRIQDVYKIRDLISKLFVTSTIDLILIIISSIFLIKINNKLFLIILLTTILYFIISFMFNKTIILKINNLKTNESEVNNQLIESFNSIETIKTMQIETYLYNKLFEKYNDLQSNSYDINNRYYKELFLRDLLMNISSLIIIYLGIIDQTFSLTNLIVFYSLMNYYFNPIENICNLHLMYLDSKSSFIRIKELLNVQEENLIDNITCNQLDNSLFIKNLKYSYNGINNTINCSKLLIKESEKVLIYGPSGSGKSTFLKLLILYLSNYNGNILIGFKNIKQYSLNEIRKKITYISQNEIIYSDTIYNNIVLNNNISYKKYIKILKITNLLNIIQNKFLKDETILENNGSNLSGGEKQKIIIARALAKESDIYIFDESFSAIDIKSERKMLIKIFQYLKNKTIIVISHRQNNKDLYQKLIMMKNGNIYENS